MSKHFDEAAKEWDKGDVRQAIAHNVFGMIVSRISLQKSMNILDFGAGTGLLSFKIAPLVNEVCGVDLSEKMLEQLEEKNTPHLQVKSCYRDICQEPMEHLYEGIVSSMAMHHVEDTQQLMRVFYEHLKPDGFIALADLDAEDGTFHKHGNEGVYHFGFERERLRTMIEKAGFRNVRFYTAHTIENERGKYQIFLVTARK